MSAYKNIQDLGNLRGFCRLKGLDFCRGFFIVKIGGRVHFSWREFTVKDIGFTILVSDDGDVRIGERTITQSNGKKAYSRVAPPKDLKPVKNSSGYYQVKINFEGGYKHFYIHRLVASLFVDNPHDHQEVDHLDGDKSNNCANNLMWVSRAENMAKCLKDNPHILQNLKHQKVFIV